MAKLGLVLMCILAVAAQQRVAITPRARPVVPVAAHTTNLRYDVRLVQIPVVVTDARGKPVVDLPRENFRLFEDDVERSISTFTQDDAPVSATLIFDSSRSMKSRMADARAAVDQFLKTSLPGDEFSLIRFSDKAEVLSPFTQDTEEISRKLASVEAKGWTALFDALCLGAHQVRRGHNQRKVMVVFSDGADNNSRYSQAEITALLREADVEVYAIGLMEKPRTLERLADETGGRALWVHKLEDLPEAMETLSRQIRSEYMIGYSPGDIQNDGKYHRIRVEVAPPAGGVKLHASWRHGYVAPGE